MFNKEKNINKEDLDRIKPLARLIGGAAVKVRIFTLNVTMMVGLNMVIEDECRPRGNGTIACKEITSPGGGEPQPCKCYDCDKVFGEETDVKPPFWK